MVHKTSFIGELRKIDEKYHVETDKLVKIMM
jgi:hypothetical protein